MKRAVNIKSPKKYEAAIAELEAIDAELEGNEAPDPHLTAYADALSDAIEEYEVYRLGKTPPTPVEAIQAAMSHGGYTRQELAQILGDKALVSRILGGTRKLNLRMVLALHAAWNIPLECLTGMARAQYVARKYAMPVQEAIDYIDSPDSQLAAALA